MTVIENAAPAPGIGSPVVLVGPREHQWVIPNVGTCAVCEADDLECDVDVEAEMVAVPTVAQYGYALTDVLEAIPEGTRIRVTVEIMP